MPKSTRPSSQMPKSSKPSSKMPKDPDFEAFEEEPTAPKSKIASKISSSKISSRAAPPPQEPKAKSTYPTAIPEDEEPNFDDYEDEKEDEVPDMKTMKKAAKSQAPKSSKPSSSKIGSRISSKIGSVMDPSSQFRDEEEEERKEEEGIAPSAAFKDKSLAPKSVMGPSSSFKDKSVAPKSLALRSEMPSSKQFRDVSQAVKSEMQPSAAHKDESSFKPASQLFSEEDFKRSKMQSAFATLPPEEQELQEEWAQKMIERSGACPEGYKWNRQEDEQLGGGYMCDAGRHAILDKSIEEGDGGLCCLKVRSYWQSEKWGPYFQNEKIKNHWMELGGREGRRVEGAVYNSRQNIFLGSERQQARAKYEFFAVNPGLVKYYGYKKPAVEPPVEWREDTMKN